MTLILAEGLQPAGLESAVRVLLESGSVKLRLQGDGGIPVWGAYDPSDENWMEPQVVTVSTLAEACERLVKLGGSVELLGGSGEGVGLSVGGRPESVQDRVMSPLGASWEGWSAWVNVDMLRNDFLDRGAAGLQRLVFHDVWTYFASLLGTVGGIIEDEAVDDHVMTSKALEAVHKVAGQSGNRPVGVPVLVEPARSSGGLTGRDGDAKGPRFLDWPVPLQPEPLGYGQWTGWSDAWEWWPDPQASRRSGS